jgi:pyridoxamine 5'-phosphate oxidase
VESNIDILSLGPDPIVEFEKLFNHVSKLNVHDASAMALASVGMNGTPSVRMVLFKGISDGCFKFYTNYNSAKAVELISNPKAAGVFYWHPVYQQIRFEGSVEKTSREDSEHYFHQRPRESQLAAFASDQSKQLVSREALLKKYKEAEKKFESRDVDCPEHWGGFKIMPEKIEFWFGNKNRLHQRLCYVKKNDESWSKTLLNP